jgi:tetratricopeptide (TPR) repeat protein
LLLGVGALCAGPAGAGPLLLAPQEAPELAHLPSGEADASPAELRDTAELRYAEGRLEEAALLYHQLAEASDDVAAKVRALIDAAWLEHRLGNDVDALATLTGALVLDPEYPFEPGNFTQQFVDIYHESIRDALVQREAMAGERNEAAIERVNANDLAGAARLFEEALELKPNDPLLLGNLAITELRLDHPEKAAAAYQKVLALDRAADHALISEELRLQALTALGAIFLDMGSYEDAATSLEEAVRRKPDARQAWQNLGIARRRLGDRSAAIEAFKAAYELDRTDPDLAGNLARVYLDDERWSEATLLLTEATAAFPERAELWLRLGLARERLGDVGAALDAYESALARDENNAQGLGEQAAGRLAYGALSRQEPARAAGAARRLTEWHPDDVEAWTYLGLALLQGEDATGAAEAFRRSSELAPTAADGPNNLGSALQSAGDLRGAEAAFRRALDRQPDFQVAATNLEQVRQQLAAPTRALGIHFVDGGDSATTGGAAVAEVAPDTIADLAKLRVGDVIVRLGDSAIENAEAFRDRVYDEPLSGVVELEVLREGKPKRLKLRMP